MRACIIITGLITHAVTSIAIINYYDTFRYNSFIGWIENLEIGIIEQDILYNNSVCYASTTSIINQPNVSWTKLMYR